MTDSAEPDIVMRWLTIIICFLMFFIGCWGLFVPHTLRKAALGIFSRLPDQSQVRPFVDFLSGRYFTLLLRLFSLFPIGMGVALLRTVR
jgi:hypothetical protein